MLKITLCLTLFCLFIVGFQFIVIKKNERYLPTWESLDSRPVPAWYDEAKVGVFMHYGLYSIPSWGSEWFWKYLSDGWGKYVDFFKKNYRPGTKYQDLASTWKAEFFDADYFASVVKRSGAKYVTFTTKHHEGFALWRSNESWNWNSVDVGPGLDFVKLLTDAMRKQDLKVCFYFSLFEWYHPLYQLDAKNNFSTQYYVDQVALPQLYDLVNTYKPDCIWADGDYGNGSTYWRSKEFQAWLYNDSPIKDVVVVNDRWGDDSLCKHGSFKICMDRFQPDKAPDFKFENCQSLDKFSWGNRREARLNDLLTIRELVNTTMQTIALGGNIVINNGPTVEGTIALIYVDLYSKLGDFLNLYGEAIYATKLFRVQFEKSDQLIRYTASKKSENTIYALFLDWPTNNQLVLTIPHQASDKANITLIGFSEPLKFEGKDKITITFPFLTQRLYSVGYAIKLEGFN